MTCRTVTGAQMRRLLPPDAVPWVPDGLFDLEVLAVLRRRDLRSVVQPHDIAASLLRLQAWRLRRASVTSLTSSAWALRSNITFADACYVALAHAQQLDAPLLTADTRLAASPTLPIAVLHP